MRVSLNQVKQYINFELPPVGELVARINQQLGGVENVIDLSDVYKDAVIVKVVECEKHPNADKLSVCKVDDGGKTKDATRDKGGLVEVVCGAPNVHAGMLAVWLPPKSIVPATYHDSEPFVLGARELRGVVSNGMLASPKELGLGDSHEGILEINPAEQTPSGVGIKPGTSFARIYGLNDTIIEIENKMFTHRPDLFGQLGVAREVAGIQHKAFKSPDWYATASVDELQPASDTLDLAVFNDAKDVVPRFMAAIVRDVTIKPSPTWLQAELVRLGGKPINNIVDVTNYIMLLTGQPTHAYDYDKLRGHKLGARLAKAGEKVTLLNHKTYVLDETDIVIVDDEGPVGLGGIMGGGDSEVGETTKHIVLECANFDMYAVRRSSMRHGIFTDALTRFNKGQSPLQNPYALMQLIQSVFDTAGGALGSIVFDEKNEISQNRKVNVTTEFINERLGLKLDEKEISALLQNVEFTVEPGLQVTAPFWRTDIELPEDIVEEVGRLYGFDKLPRELPKRSILPAIKNPENELKQKIRQSLSKAGANEVLTYSFVHEKLLTNAEYGTKGAFRLSNALSPDLHYYRPRILPSLLDKVHMNIKSGYDEFTLFEIGKGHDKGLDLNEEGLPREPQFVDVVYAAKKPQEGAAFYRVRRLLDQLADDLGLELVYAANKFSASTRLFEPSRSAFVNDKVSGAFIGIVGEFAPSVMKKFKLPPYSAGLMLDFEGLRDASIQSTQSYRPLSRFPSVTQDISLITDVGINYRSVETIVVSILNKLEEDFYAHFEPTSIYRADGASQKTTTFRITVSNSQRTLTENEVTAILGDIAALAKREIGASV